MTNNAYLKIVRQYAALSKRFNRSYAEAVNAVVQSRLDFIVKSGLEGGSRTEALDAAMDMAEREYGLADRDFKLDVKPF